MLKLISLVRTFIFLATAAAFARVVVAEEAPKVSAGRERPIAQPPINYWAADSQDPIAKLNRKIENGGLKLEFSDRFGYLPAVLKELEISASSQLLRYGSAGLHHETISPKRPRAFYFNDDALVTWFADVSHLEIAAQDSQKGTLFYTLDNRRDAAPRFSRAASGSCMACHGSSSWHLSGFEAPGHIVRERHISPIDLRWESRYVTGMTPMQKHLGNMKMRLQKVADDFNPGRRRDAWVYVEPRQQIVDLKEEFDTSRYLIDTSDVAAHLVFDHQMYGHNLLTRLSYEHQWQMKSKRIETMVVGYLLLNKEAPLDQPAAGKSAYAEWYQSRGPKDAEGRSLYDLDLSTRLFRHRISPLIQSRMVQNFPAELQQSLYRRLNDVLAGKEQLKDYSVPEADRQITMAILRATVPGWPVD